MRRIGAAAVLAVSLVVFVTAAVSAPPAFTVGNISVAEGVGDATFTVTLADPAPPEGVALTFSTSNGTATAPGDYTAQTNAAIAVIPDGSTTGTFTVPINDDSLDENNEQFTVTVRHAEGGDQTATATIQADSGDAPPSTTSFGDDTVTEGDSGTLSADFTVQLSGPSGKQISIPYSTANGSADSTDYVPESGSLVIPAGQTSGTISIAVRGDTLPESTENFFVNLSSGTNVTLGSDTQAQGTITDDGDEPVSASINDVSVTEGHTGTVNATFTVSLSAPAAAQVQIQYRTANGSAVAPDDYTAVTPSAILTIAQGASSGQITIVVKGDTLPEGTSENFFVDLISATGPATISSDFRGTGTITDDDSPVSASINDVSVTEGHTGTVNATFTVQLSGAAQAQVQIRYSTVNGSAVTPDDYTGVTNQLLTIPQGSSSGTFNIVVKGDTLPEGTGENFFADLVSVTGPATISTDSRGEATIVDDDAPVSASINDVSVTEGHSGTINATFTVQLSGAAAAQVQIRYSTLNGSATSPDDYTGVTNQLLTIPQGSNSGTLNIVVKGDTIPEGEGSPLAQDYFVDLISATGPATISADSRGTGKIIDDDSPVLASINDVAVTEGHAGNVNATFTVQLSGPAQAQVQIRYSTINGSATEPADYTAATSLLLTIPQSASSGTFSIVVKGDTVPEGAGSPLAETFFVDLLSATGPATISADSRGTGSIVDDDSPVTASINDVSVTEGNTGTVNATFTVTLSAPAQAAVQIRYSTLNGSATAPNDYTAATNLLLTIPQSASSGTFSIVVKADTTYEGNESFFVDLISVTGPATISADSRGTGTINEDDPAPPPPPPPPGGGGGGGGSLPLLSINDVGTREGETVTFTVTLSGSTSQAVTVRFNTVNGTATAGSDYEGTEGVLSFAAGEKTKTIAVTTRDETLEENSENFIVSLTEPRNATIAKSFGTATIEANDQVTPAGPGGPGAGPGPGPSGPTVLLPRMVLGPRSVNVNARGVASLTVTCAKNSPINCTGSVLLETSTVVPKFQLGKKGFTLRKGKKITVYLKLSERGLKLLAKKGTLRVRAVVFVRNSKQQIKRFVPGLLMLKASPALVAKLGPKKTLTKTLTAKPPAETPTGATPAATTPAPKPKPKPKPEPAPLPPIDVEIVP